MAPRIPRRPAHAFPLFIGILLLSVIGLRHAAAQQDRFIEGLSPQQLDQLNAAQESPRDRFAVPVDVSPQQRPGQPVDMSVYQNPDVTGDGQPDDPNLRKGSCCVLSEFEKAGGCLWGIGVDLQGQAALDSCKAVGGIHYVQGDLSQYLDGSPVPDLSWKACSIQCGVLKRVTYCYPETYTCSAKPPEADLWGEVPWYDTPGECATACVQPVDLQTSVGCACGEGAAVRCSIDVAQNPETVSDATPARPARLSRVIVEIDGDGGLQAGGAFVVDAQGVRTDQVIDAGDLEGDGSVLEFTSASFVIPGAGEGSRKGRGGGFHAEVTLRAGDGVENLLRVETVQSAPDPSPENDVAYSTIPMLQHCGAFLLNAQCVLEGEAPALRHTYTLDLPVGTGEETRVTFDLNPGDAGGCLDPQTVEIPASLAGYCENQPDSASLACTVPPGGSRTAAPRPEQLAFSVAARATTACPAGTAIPVTAEVMTGTQPPLRFEVTDKKIPCGQCDVCGAYATRETCDAAPRDGSGVSYCGWRYVAKTDDFRCVSNDRNPACPIWYGCCMPTPYLHTLMSTNPSAVESAQETANTYVYAGRVDGRYRPAADEQSPFGVGSEELFDIAEQCYQQGLRTGYVTRWHRQPNETITDPAVPQSVQESMEQCEERSIRRRDQESSTGPGPQSRRPRPEGEHDWYCSFAYEDIVADVTASLQNLVARKDCEVFEPDVNPSQTLIEGTAYAAVAYNQKDTPEGDRFSCPATCELVTKKWGTCYVAAEGACRTHYDLDQCIGAGDTFFTDGAAGQGTCTRTCKGGLCGPAPAGWTRPGPDEAL